VPPFPSLSLLHTHTQPQPGVCANSCACVCDLRRHWRKLVDWIVPKMGEGKAKKSKKKSLSTCCNCRVSTRKCTCVTISRKRKWQQCALLPKWKIKVIAVSLMAMSAWIFLGFLLRFWVLIAGSSVWPLTLCCKPRVVYAVYAIDRLVLQAVDAGLTFPRGQKPSYKPQFRNSTPQPWRP